MGVSYFGSSSEVWDFPLLVCLWQSVHVEQCEEDSGDKTLEVAAAACLFLLCFNVFMDLKFGFIGVLDSSVLQLPGEQNQTSHSLEFSTDRWFLNHFWGLLMPLFDSGWYRDTGQKYSRDLYETKDHWTNSNYGCCSYAIHNLTPPSPDALDYFNVGCNRGKKGLCEVWGNFF